MSCFQGFHTVTRQNSGRVMVFPVQTPENLRQCFSGFVRMRKSSVMQIRFSRLCQRDGAGQADYAVLGTLNPWMRQYLIEDWAFFFEWTKWMKRDMRGSSGTKWREDRAFFETNEVSEKNARGGIRTRERLSSRSWVSLRWPLGYPRKSAYTNLRESIMKVLKKSGLEKVW